MVKKTLFPLGMTFVCLLSIILTGCGGGGQSGSPSQSPANTTPFQSRKWQVSDTISQNELPTGMALEAISNDIVFIEPGHAIAVWNQLSGGQLNVFAADFHVTSGWSSPRLISNRLGNDSYSPRVKADSNGNAIVVWQTNNSQIGIAHFLKASGWQNDYYLPYSCSSFDIAGSPDNSFFLVMSNWNGAHFTVSSLRYSSQGDWTGPTLLQFDSNVDSFQAAVSFSDSGDGFAVWVQYDRDINQTGARKYIWVSRFSASTGWQPSVRIGNQSAGDASTPMVGVDGKGNAIVAWSQLDGESWLPATTRSNIWFSRYRAGVGWDIDQLLSDDNPGNAYSPSVAMNADGNAIVAWRQSTLWMYGDINLWFKSFTADKGWGATGIVSGDISWDNEGFQGRITTAPALAIDKNGYAIVAWDLPYLSGKNIASSRFIPETGWTKAELIDLEDAGYGYAPKVSVDETGNVNTTWCNAKGDTTQPVFSIWTNRLE